MQKARLALWVSDGVIYSGILRLDGSPGKPCSGLAELMSKQPSLRTQPWTPWGGEAVRAMVLSQPQQATLSVLVLLGPASGLKLR